MLEKVPNDDAMITLLGRSLYDVWVALCALIDAKYDTDRLWNNGYKEWTYEYKYRRGGKTLCTFYAKENCFNFMVVLGSKSGKNLKRAGQNIPKRFGAYMTKRRRIMTENGYGSN